ncbi:hypothetical protein DFJ58DRAFT_840107 [Suillus subalutaceus]|uniref:uncharacterized protein n=1 Tax=Suillus subalutaceus TaxID=48586 RepID=UPI001B8774B1|nr:uncharacterized protein DFJ58DRAFT_840107 [Suillus subalutaceus]KAG1859518.1 hypothetical protein DFJ58DRAFT_840107 [Suillus subalutaceus]
MVLLLMGQRISELWNIFAVGVVLSSEDSMSVCREVAQDHSCVDEDESFDSSDNKMTDLQINLLSSLRKTIVTFENQITTLDDIIHSDIEEFKWKNKDMNI